MCLPESLQPELFNIMDYRPSRPEKVVHIGGLRPLDRKFLEGNVVKCVAGKTPKGVIVADIVCQGYDKTCQVQCSPINDMGDSEEGVQRYNVFSTYCSLKEGDDTEGRMPEELVRGIFDRIFSQVESELRDGGNGLGGGKL